MNKHETAGPVIDRLSAIEFPVALVLGQTRMRIRDVMNLSAGSMVDLDRREGEMAEVTVRGMVVARGEVVSVGGNYGLRVVEVMDQSSRMAAEIETMIRARRDPALQPGRARS